MKTNFILRLGILASLILVHFISFAQQGNVWTFGANARVDFNTPIPTVGTSSISAYEGCASMCDNSGNLLFYTDGINVWDATNTIINLGTPLMGHFSAAQSGIIVPEPGITVGSSTGRYYIFSIPELASGHVRFSIYNSTTNLLTTTNQMMPDGISVPTTTESITVARHCNGIDYWVITHEMGNNRFKAYLLTNTGVSAPINSNVGPNVPVAIGSPANINSACYMKISHNSTKLAFIVRKNSVNLLDFNPSTGVISNNTTIANGNSFANFYGVEFSPNDNLVYYTNITTGVYQYNINTLATNLVDNQNAGNTNNLYGALQLAPNGIIYMSRDGDSNMGTINQNYLSTIQSPNSTFVGPGGVIFTSNGLQLQSGTGCKVGLPNIIPSLDPNTLTVSASNDSICAGSSATLTATGGTTYSWFPAIGLNTTVGSSVIASPSTTQTYTVSTILNGCVIYTKDVTVTVTQNTLTANVAANLICVGDSTVLTANGGTTYTWSPPIGLNTNIGSPVIAAPTSSQVYTVATTINGCLFTQQVAVETQNCCFAAQNNAVFTTINTNQTYTNHTVLAGKYYIAPNVVLTVDGTTLDLTNVDMIFDECAGIQFVNGGEVIAYNSVFRPCDESKSWLGFNFINGTGNISASTFKNAQKAIQLNGSSSVRILTNNFLNNQIGVYLLNDTQVDPISGNQFTTDHIAVDYQTCQNTFANSDVYAIWGRNSFIRDVISQNNFINGDFNNQKNVYGIYLVASNSANISSNVFTNQYTSIYASSSARLSIENNQIELTNLYTYPGVSGADIQIYCLNTSNNISITGNKLQGRNLYSTHGIYIQSCNRIFVLDNELRNFATAILTQRSSSQRIINNTIKNTTTGIHSNDSKLSYFGCNIIQCDEANSTGIYFSQTNNQASSCQINSNCIYNSTIAIDLTKIIVGGINTLPLIKNNFLYGYRSFGIRNTNFSGNIGSGLTGLTAGKNTFSSNNVNGGAIDISTNTSITSIGNFGITNISANVSLTGNNTFYSTASCANQLGNAPTQYSNDDMCLNTLSQQTLNAITSIGTLTPSFETEMNNLAENDKKNCLMSLATEIAAPITSEDMLRLHQYVTSSSLSTDDQSWVLAKLYALQTNVALQFLSSIEENQELAFIEAINVKTLTNEMTSEQFADLLAIQNSYSIHREVAREALNVFGGAFPYRITAENGSDYGISNESFTAIDENTLSVFPNPANTMVTIAVSIPNNQNSTLIITDLAGKIIYSKSVVENYTTVEVDVTAYAKGMYLVKVADDQTVSISTKLTVIH